MTGSACRRGVRSAPALPARRMLRLSPADGEGRAGAALRPPDHTVHLFLSFKIRFALLCKSQVLLLSGARSPCTLYSVFSKL